MPKEVKIPEILSFNTKEGIQSLREEMGFWSGFIMYGSLILPEHGLQKSLDDAHFISH